MAEVETTEIDEFSVDRLDGVFSPANGIPFLMLKSTADPGAGSVFAAALRKDVGDGGEESSLLNDAVTAVLGLLQLEADDLDADDAAMLMSALNALLAYGTDELDEDEGEVDDMDALGLTKVLKSASADELGELRKALVGDVDARLDRFEANLAEIRKAAAPGGPVRMNPRPSSPPATPHLTKAREIREKLGKITDPGLREAYLLEAREQDQLAKAAGEEEAPPHEPTFEQYMDFLHSRGGR